MQFKTKIVSCYTANSKPVKQEVNGTVILPPLVFPDQLFYLIFKGGRGALALNSPALSPFCYFPSLRNMNITLQFTSVKILTGLTPGLLTGSKIGLL